MFVYHRFELARSVQQEIQAMTPRFGYGAFGEAVFYRTFSRIKENGGQESWNDVVIRVTNGTFSIRKDWYLKNHLQWSENYWQQYARRFAHSLFHMHWTPPGRGLWMMGTPFVYERGSLALYNCFSGDTEFYTREKGSVKFKDCVGEIVHVLCPDQSFRPAIVRCFGKQKLRTITFQGGGASKALISIEATRNHRWILKEKDGTTRETTCLMVGNKVEVTPTNYDYLKGTKEYNEGFCHGMIFADGNQNTYYPNRFSIRLCGWKNKFKEILEQSESFRTTCQPPSYNFVTLISDTINLKQLPIGQSIIYQKGFFDAWVELDGNLHDSKTKTLRRVICTQDAEAAEWCRKNATLFGYVVVGHSIQNNVTNYGPRSNPLHKIVLSKDKTLFKVEYIVDEDKEENVYCVEEPVTHQFTLAYGLPTGNCSSTFLGDQLHKDIGWMMDCLMHGVGVGFYAVRDDSFKVYLPKGFYDFVIPDSREGWIESVEKLIHAFLHPNQKEPRFNYDEIRPANMPIRGFGGVSSGPEPLALFHDQIRRFFIRYIQYKYNGGEYYDIVMLKTDLANCVGCMVTAGNLRRSAELGHGSIQDEIFLDLKNPKKYKYREDFSWMSNNSAILEENEDFEKLGEIAKRVLYKGEPGIINLKNWKYGRIGKNDVKIDKRCGLANPCGEITMDGRLRRIGHKKIPIGGKELCNLAETYPTRCDSIEEWYESCEYGTFYCSTVALLPTHRPETNQIVAKNRRIGVSLTDFIAWKTKHGTHNIIRYLRKGYKIIRKMNRRLALEAGIPESIRVTCVKPSGTVSKMVGCIPGMSNPNFEYMIRRMRVQKWTPFWSVLVEAGIPHEEDLYSANTDVFEFPIHSGNHVKCSHEVTIWEQALNLVLLQREWADNSVSATLMFKPKWELMSETTDPQKIEEELEHLNQMFQIDGNFYTDKNFKIKFRRNQDNQITRIKQYRCNPKHEEDDVEPCLSSIVPLIKSVSLLPQSSKGAYKQMPEEEISREEYLDRVSKIKKIDWSKLSNHEPEGEKYCTTEQCEIGGGI